MSPKIFSQTEKENLKLRMFEAGFALLKEYGMTHMSVEKITFSAGIGKSTFYNFFPSKEAFVWELIEFKRQRFWEKIDILLNGREKMTRQEGQNVLKNIILNPESVYQYLTPEDEVKIYAALPEETKVNLKEETEIMQRLFGQIENIRENMDYAVVSNLLKILAMMAEDRQFLHEEGYQRTQDKLFALLFNCIFEEGTHEI